MGRKEQIVTGLDIGTTSIRAIIAACGAEQGIRILGVGTKPAEGVRKSSIVDSAKATAAIRATIEEAEHDAHTNVSNVHVNIGGSHIQSGSSDAVVNLKDNEDTVRSEHIADLLDKARANTTEKGREFVHIIPSEYRIDGHGGNQAPIGVKASRVQLIAHMITADRAILESHARAVNDAGFQIADLCFSVIADGHAVLSEQEKKEGVLIIDVGGGTTSYAVYFNNTVYFSRVLAVGGDHVTNDIALGLQLSVQDAEQLKCSYGRLVRITDAQQNPNAIRVQTTDKKTRNVLRQDVDMIIDSRIEELLQFIAAEIDSRQLRPLLSRGVVFVGGGAHLHRFIERAEKVFAPTVRVGIPQLFTGQDKRRPVDFHSERHEFLRDTMFSTVLGLVRYGFISQSAPSRQAPSTFIKIIKSIFSLS